MVVLKAKSKNGQIILEEPLPPDLEGKELEVLIVERKSPKKRRQSGSAKGQIVMSPDFDEPLEDFDEYMS